MSSLRPYEEGDVAVWNNRVCFVSPDDHSCLMLTAWEGHGTYFHRVSGFVGTEDDASGQHCGFGTTFLVG
jgi:hypothetical protein